MSLIDYLRSRGYPEDLYFQPVCESCREASSRSSEPPRLPASSHRPDAAELPIRTRPGGGFPDLVEK